MLSLSRSLTLIHSLFFSRCLFPIYKNCSRDQNVNARMRPFDFAGHCALENYYYYYYPLSPEYDDETREDASARVNHSLSVQLLDFLISVVRCEYNEYIVPFPIVYCPARKHSQILFS
jgi:hypothetical protein